MPIRPPVQLGRPSRAGAGAPGAPPVDHVEQFLAHQPVEVERRSCARKLESLGGIVAADRLGLVHHIVVQLAAGRFVERGDRRDLSLARLHSITNPC